MSPMGSPLRPRYVVVSTLVIVIVIVIGTLAVTLSTPAHGSGPGGDPHGEVLHALSTVSGAVPAGSTAVTTSTHDAVWTTACPGSGLKDGWSPVTDLTRFTTTESALSVVTIVGQTLAREGWKPSPPRDDAAWQYTPIAEWSKPVAGATSAVVVVFPYPNGSAAGADWMLGAEGKTVGFALPGC
jgi:hypothetical protein